MKLYKYKDFIEDSILENALESINESIIYYSPKLRNTFKSIDNPISKEMSDSEGKNPKEDITFLDIDEDGYLSFTTMRNAKKYLSDVYPVDHYMSLHEIDTIYNTRSLAYSNDLYDISKRTSNFWNDTRNKIKLGRFVNKLFPGKYKDFEIEDFVNKFKSTIENMAEKFSIVEGDKIAYWYNENNYYKIASTLGSSCMKGKSSRIFKIYTHNPEVCRMLIVTEDNKLKGRALIWKVNVKDNQFEYFMDRQYVIDGVIVEKMKDYAKENGWAYKTVNAHTNQSITFKDNTLFTKMEVTLKSVGSDLDFDYNNYPYMDTFKRYDPSKGYLFNDSDDVTGNYLLEDTDGGFTVIESGNYSEYYDERIPEDQSVYSDALDDYLWKDRSTYVTVGGHRGWYPTDYDDICYDDRKERYLHNNDAVYSEFYSTYIYMGDAISIVHRINENYNCNYSNYYLEIGDDDYVSYDDLNEFIWFQNITSSGENWQEHDGILKKLLSKDSAGDWIIDKFKIKVYKVLDEGVGISNLSLIDAKLLGIEVDQSNFLIDEKWGYTNDLQNAKLFEKLKKSIVHLLKNKQMTIDFGKGFDDRSEEINSEMLKRLKELNDNMYI